jgi:hypothetical protein
MPSRFFLARDAELVTIMTLRMRVIVTTAALFLAACTDQSNWVKTQLGRPPSFEIDTAIVAKIRADTIAQGFPEASDAVEKTLNDTIQLPGHVRWFATLIGTDGSSLIQVGTKSTKIVENSVEIDFIVKSKERGLLDIHAALEKSNGIWEATPGSYSLTMTPPIPTKKGGDKINK